MSDSAPEPDTRHSTAPPNPSSGQKRQPPLSSREIPAEVRLNYHREVPIERLRSATPKPDGYIPPTFLPNWPDIPLDAKLPRLKLPSDLYVLSRGGLGHTLYHDPKYYTIYDPYHHERVINEPYNALHDPHAKNYLKKPSVRRHLMRQGLITARSQVLCSQREFNTYRKYLSTLYNEEVLNKLREKDMKEFELHKSDMELKQMLEKSASRSNFHKSQNAKLRQRKIYEDRVQKIAERQQTAEAKEERHKQEILEKRFTKQMLAFELDEARRSRVAEYKRHVADKQAQAYQLQVYKENVIAERIKQDKKRAAEEKRTNMLEWMGAKWDFQETRLQQDALIKETIQSDFVEKVKKRQKNVEHYRAILPQIVAKQKKERERTWNLVRKFFYRWLNKVRERKSRVPDAEHQSLWNVTQIANETVKYLHKESGYEKLDDLILGILKLKRDIKAEMEREAAEEALETQAFEDDEIGEAERKHSGDKRKPSSSP